MDDEAFALEQRVLCSDGACIGLVGEDGRCKLCGKAYAGPEPLPAAVERAEEPPVENAPDDPDKEPQPDPAERVCCPDECCVGILGEDGRCGTCGKTP